VTGIATARKTLLALAAYIPILAFIAIRTDDRALRIGALLVAATLTMASVAMIVTAKKRTPPTSLTVAAVSPPAGGAWSGYVAACLPAFLLPSLPATADLLAYALFLALAVLIHIRTPMFQINPLIALLGYRTSYVTDTSGAAQYLIVRGQIRVNDTVDAAAMSTDTYLVTTTKEAP